MDGKFIEQEYRSQAKGLKMSKWRNDNIMTMKTDNTITKTNKVTTKTQHN